MNKLTFGVSASCRDIAENKQERNWLKHMGKIKSNEYLAFYVKYYKDVLAVRVNIKIWFLCK